MHTCRVQVMDYYGFPELRVAANLHTRAVGEDADVVRGRNAVWRGFVGALNGHVSVTRLSRSLPLQPISCACSFGNSYVLQLAAVCCRHDHQGLRVGRQVRLATGKHAVLAPSVAMAPIQRHGAACGHYALHETAPPLCGCLLFRAPRRVGVSRYIHQPWYTPPCATGWRVDARDWGLILPAPRCKCIAHRLCARTASTAIYRCHPQSRHLATHAFRVPQNGEPKRYRLQPSCCRVELNPRGSAYQCAHPWQPSTELPYGNPVTGRAWDKDRPDFGKYDGGDFQDTEEFKAKGAASGQTGSMGNTVGQGKGGGAASW